MNACAWYYLSEFTVTRRIQYYFHQNSTYLKSFLSFEIIISSHLHATLGSPWNSKSEKQKENISFKPRRVIPDVTQNTILVNRKDHPHQLFQHGVHVVMISLCMINRGVAVAKRGGTGIKFFVNPNQILRKWRSGCYPRCFCILKTPS